MPDKTRKGARSRKEIPPEILDQLNNGKIESANLVEWLAVDQKLLLENTLSGLNRTEYLDSVFSAINDLKKQTVTTVHEAIGKTLSEQASIHDDAELPEQLAAHPSDVVRCWAAHAATTGAGLSVEEKLNRTARFAADSHFGVREMAWLAVRGDIIQNLHESIVILTEWTQNRDENIRRFTTEATRPRGVWCAHINVLKQNPEHGLPLLEPLKSDSSKYVRDSVGNWLNDASKTRPDFVKDLCARWETESDTPETAYIIKKALRALAKQGK